MLGCGLVFIYDLIPLVAAYRFSETLPNVFKKATMRLSEKKVKTISVIGICILIGQGTLSFSDIDRSGWILVLVYILLVKSIIKNSAHFIERASRQATKLVLN